MDYKLKEFTIKTRLRPYTVLYAWGFGIKIEVRQIYTYSIGVWGVVHCAQYI